MTATATANANANAASSKSQSQTNTNTNTNTNINTNNNNDDGVEKEKPLTPSSLSRPDPPSLLDEETQKGQAQKPPFQSSEIGNANTNNSHNNINSHTNNNEDDEDEDEDEMVKQARAIALSAAMLSKQQLQHKKHTNKGGLNNILNLTSLTNLNLNMNMGMGMTVKADQELPLGDIQQRKIIEEKMKQQQQQQQQQQQSDHTTMAMAMSSNPLKAVGGLAEVKEKFDGFIKEQQQKIEETFTGAHNRDRDRDRDRDASASLSGSPIRLNSRSAEDSHSNSHSLSHTHVPYPIPMMDEKVDNLILSTSSVPAPNGNASMGMSIGTNTNKDAITNTNTNTNTITNTNTNTHTTTTTTNAHVDAMDEDDAPIILSSIVYKRRSGYGRYSTSRAWERRRMDVKGSTIRYFKTIDPEKEPHLYDASDDDPSVQSDLNSNSRPPSPLETGSTGASASAITGIGIGNSGTSNSNSNSNSNSIETKQHKKKDIRDFWEQAKENITKTTETITTSLTLTAQAALDPNAPRGTIDLVKEHATVSTLSVSDSQSNSMATAIAMGGSWGSPTPFGISILTKSEVKWKICFDTQKEQMQWLIALTDIVVKNTVESYNDELTKSRRGLRGGPASGNDIGIGIGIGNNNINSHGDGGHGEGLASLGGEEVLRSPPGGREDALWKTDDRYTMRNIVYGSGTGTGTDTKSGVDAKVKTESDPNKDTSPIKVDGKMEGGDEYEMADTKFQMIYNLVNQGARSGPAISLKGNNIYLLSGFINVALYIVSAIESKWAFRFFVMAANCFFWILVTNDPDGGASASGKDNDKEKGKGKDDVDIRPKLLRSSFLNLMESFTSTSNRTTTAPSTKTVIEDRPKIVKAKVQLPKIKEGFKPSLGSSTACVTDFSEEDIAIARKKRLTWNILPLDSVQVRSHGYLKTKKKIPSPSSLYEIIGCEILTSDVRVSDFATKVELPKIAFEDDGERTWVSPDIFVISLAVPSAEPSMTRPTTDGEGFSLTVYYKMKKETRTLLRTITAPEYDPSLHSIHAGEDDAGHQRSITNAVKLWEDWCRTAPTDEKMQSRFKFIPNIHNPKEIGLPSYISKYCGKPVLIKRANVTGFLSSHPHLNAMEFGISLHPFPYLAKKALAYLKTNVFPKAIVSLSYVIEGRSDEELPEVLIGDAVKVICPDPEHAFEYEDFLAGATESSPATTDPESNDQINRASENKDQ